MNKFLSRYGDTNLDWLSFSDKLAIGKKEFEEDLHPRDDQGRFSAGGSGYTRGEGGVYRDTAGNEMPAEDHARMLALHVPPGWSDVQLNPDKEGSLLARGIDKAGRNVSITNSNVSDANAADKFERLKEFNQAVPGIREQALSDMKNTNLSQSQRDTAASLYLIDQTGFRIGSTEDRGAEKQAYGATTLTGEHVSIDGNNLKFEFTGKSGVNITKELTNPVLADYLRDDAGSSHPLFATNGGKVRDYLKATAGNDDFQVKDYRTYWGTAIALDTIGKMPVPSNAKEYVSSRVSVGKTVASFLGNTPAVALGSYIDPLVFSRWDKF